MGHRDHDQQFYDDLKLQIAGEDLHTFHYRELLESIAVSKEHLMFIMINWSLIIIDYHLMFIISSHNQLIIITGWWIVRKKQSGQGSCAAQALSAEDSESKWWLCCYKDDYLVTRIIMLLQGWLSYYKHEKFDNWWQSLHGCQDNKGYLWSKEVIQSSIRNCRVPNSRLTHLKSCFHFLARNNSNGNITDDKTYLGDVRKYF